MKIIREHIVVKVESIFFDETKYKGVDGRQILMNVLYNPERHVRNYGIVTSIPDELYMMPLLPDSIGLPKYHDNPVFEWKTNQDIQLEVQIGDKVYFHYNCLLPDNYGDGNMYNKLYLFSQKEDGKLMHYFRVKYELVFAAVRYKRINHIMNEFKWGDEEKLKPWRITNSHKSNETLFGYTDSDGFDQIYRRQVDMIGSYVLVQPDMETWEDISIPTPEVVDGKKLLNADGSVRMKPREQWLVRKAMPTEKYLRGWVRYCGTPLHGDKEFVKPGMYVYFQRFANTKLKFEGEEYFRMRQRHIFGIDQEKSQEQQSNHVEEDALFLESVN